MTISPLNNLSLLLTIKCIYLFLQIDVLNRNVKLAESILQRCPSCFNNLVRHICDFTCSPKQSTFMRVQSYEKGADGKLYLIIHAETETNESKHFDELWKQENSCGLFCLPNKISIYFFHKLVVVIPL